MRAVGSYRLIENIGHGTTGLIFKAEHVSAKNIVALKLMRPGLARNPDFSANFLRECRFAQSVDHPHVGKIYDAGEAGGHLYMAQEFITGTSLTQMLREKGNINETQLLRIILDVADALESLNKANILLPGLSPSNIMIDSDGSARVSGLGLGRTPAANATQARPNVAYGPLGHLAPEVIRGGRDADVRTGVYSLGTIMFQALTGLIPFSASTAQETIRKILFDQTPDPRQFVPSILPGTRDIVMKAMARDREERFATPAALAGAIMHLQTNPNSTEEDTVITRTAEAPPPPPVPEPAPVAEAAPAPAPEPESPPPAAEERKPTRFYRGTPIYD